MPPFFAQGKTLAFLPQIITVGGPRKKIACGYTIPITFFGIPHHRKITFKGMEFVGQAGFEAIELELYDELLPEHRRDIGAMKEMLTN